MENENFDIETLKVGDVLWFMDSLRADTEYADGLNVQDAFVYSAEISKIEMTAFTKGFGSYPDEKTYQIDFRDSDSWGLSYQTREGAHNRRFYLTRDEALKDAREWNVSNLADAEEQLVKAQKAVEFLRVRVAGEIIETTYDIAMDSGNYMETLIENIAKAKAAEAE